MLGLLVGSWVMACPRATCSWAAATSTATRSNSLRSMCRVDARVLVGARTHVRAREGRSAVPGAVELATKQVLGRA